MHNTAVLAEPETGPLFVTAEDAQAEEWLRRAKEADKRRLRQQVTEVADYFAAVTPGRTITEADRMTTAIMVAGSAARVRPLLRRLPFASDMPTGTTRREYADTVRAQQGGEGDLPPSPIHIPGIPRQPQRPDNALAGVQL